MVAKIIDATEAKVGTNIIIEGEVYTVKRTDTSKTGKHGHAKVRMEAVGIINNQKKVLAVSGHDRFEVPIIYKKRGQVLSIGNKIGLMDLESFETLELDCPDEEIRAELEINSNVEYWDIEGIKVIKRKA